MRISDWSSDVCSSDLQDDLILIIMLKAVGVLAIAAVGRTTARLDIGGVPRFGTKAAQGGGGVESARPDPHVIGLENRTSAHAAIGEDRQDRSEEPTSELQSLMRKTYAVLHLKNKKQTYNMNSNTR